MESLPDIQVLWNWLQQWWPALVCSALAYWGLRFLLGSRKRVSPLESGPLKVHQIRSTLACSEAEAKKLLAIYHGNVEKAIQEVKTGKATIPGREVSDLAYFGGEFASCRLLERELELKTNEGVVKSLSLEGESFLFLGVVAPEQRADRDGLSRADRNPTYGQLFWREGQDWVRFLLNARRTNYVVLGERKQNVAIRNFRTVLEDLLKAVPTLQQDRALPHFFEDLRAPHFASLAELEAAALGALSETYPELKEGSEG